MLFHLWASLVGPIDTDCYTVFKLLLVDVRQLGDQFSWIIVIRPENRMMFYHREWTGWSLSASYRSKIISSWVFVIGALRSHFAASKTETS